jgi:hypothetical protein
VDVNKGIEEFQQAERDLSGIVNNPENSEGAQVLMGFDLSNFLNNSGMILFSFILSGLIAD